MSSSNNPAPAQTASTTSTQSSAQSSTLKEPPTQSQTGLRAKNSATSLSATKLSNSFAFIQVDKLRFLIMDAPSDNNLPLYIKEFEKYNCRNIVRVCHPTYSTEPLTKLGITVHDWAFDDGEAPPSAVIDDWLKLVETVFMRKPTTSSSLKPSQSRHSSSPVSPSEISNVVSANTTSESTTRSSQENISGKSVASTKGEEESIAVHCVAGLGRAPVLVAIAMIENGWSALDSVAFIREKRRGAINNKQLKFLEGYKRRRKEKCLLM